MDGITERAGVKLAAFLERANAGPDTCVRYDGGQLRLGDAQCSDLLFEFGGRTVLAVDPSVAEAAAGRKLDYESGKFCFVEV